MAITASTQPPARSASRASTLASIGVCGYLIALALPMAVPFDVPLVFLVVLATVAALVGLHQARPPVSLASLAVLGFVLARVLSSVLGSDAGRSLRLMAPFLPALVLFLVLSEWVETKRQIVGVYVCLAGAALALAITLTSSAWLGGGADAAAWAEVIRTPLLVVKNDVSIAAILAPLALAIAWMRPQRLVAVAVLAALALLIGIIVLLQSRTGLLTAMVAIVAFTALAGRRLPARHAVRAIGGIVTVALVVDACFGFHFVTKIAEDWQGRGRLALWAAALSMFHSAPVLGHGASSYVAHYRAAMPELPSWVTTESHVTPWPHNLYLELLAEQGLVGLLAFLALAGVGLFLLARIVRSRHADVRCLGAGAGAALIAFLTAAFFELSFLRVWVTIVLFTVLGLLAALDRLAKRASAC